MSFDSECINPVHVPTEGGSPRWFSGDLYEIKLSQADTGGQLGLVRATVPPGGGPPPHTHHNSDETFYLLSGQLEFLNGNQTFVARAGDAVFLPRNTLHRFRNDGLHPATMLFMYTPAGVERVFLEGGEVPRPGVPIPQFDPASITPELLEMARSFDTYLPS